MPLGRCFLDLRPALVPTLELPSPVCSSALRMSISPGSSASSVRHVTLVHGEVLSGKVYQSCLVYLLCQTRDPRTEVNAKQQIFTAWYT